MSSNQIIRLASWSNFPFSSDIIAGLFGKEKKRFYIHGVFIKEDFFATSQDFPHAIKESTSFLDIKSGSLPHITSDTGKTLIHFLCTGEYKSLDEVNHSATTSELEKLLKQNISNLFAAEMCNISKLQMLIRLKIEKTTLSLNIFRTIKLVDSFLDSQDIKERKDKTAKSREWLIEHLKKQLKVALEGSEKILKDFKLFEFIFKNAFLKTMGTEMIRFMLERIKNIQTELSQVKDCENNTRRMLE